MKIIGVTGGIGSGKTTICKMFEEYGALIIDADEISRNITKNGEYAYFEILEFFGNDILLPNKELDRKKIAGIVFSDKEKLEKLEEITHKFVFLKMEEKIKNAKEDVVVLDVPLLFSSEFPFKLDLTVGIVCDIDLRIKRVIARDNVTKEEVMMRIKNQISDEEICEKADVIIENNSLDNSKEMVRKIINRLRNE